MAGLAAFLTLRYYRRSPPAKSRSDIKNKLPPPFRFICLIGLLQIPYLFFIKGVCDRYLIILAPFAIIFCLKAAQSLNYSKLVFVTSLFILFIISLFTYRDTIAWNKTAWEIAESLKQSGVAASHIDGGYAWNGWNYRETIDIKYPDPPRSKRLTIWYLNGLFPRVDNKYTVSFSPLDGYYVIGKKEYRSLLRSLKKEENFIYLLKRID
jgi:hypothetical protein